MPYRATRPATPGAAVGTSDAELSADARSVGSPAPIAIVGLSCRFPGAPDCSALWDLLAAGGGETPEADSAKEAIHVYDTPGLGQTLDFDFQPALTLHAVRKALAAFRLHPGELTDTKIGIFTEVASLEQTLDRPLAMPSQLSRVLDSAGPGAAVTATRAEFATAVHAAYQSLCTGESDMALVIATSPRFTLDHLCSPFDGPRSEDTCDGTGVAADDAGLRGIYTALVLKRLEDALFEDDEILAVVRSASVHWEEPSAHPSSGLPRTVPSPAPQPPCFVVLDGECNSAGQHERSPAASAATVTGLGVVAASPRAARPLADAAVAAGPLHPGSGQSTRSCYLTLTARHDHTPAGTREDLRLSPWVAAARRAQPAVRHSEFTFRPEPQAGSPSSFLVLRPSQPVCAAPHQRRQSGQADYVRLTEEMIAAATFQKILSQGPGPACREAVHPRTATDGQRRLTSPPEASPAGPGLRQAPPRASVRPVAPASLHPSEIARLVQVYTAPAEWATQHAALASQRRVIFTGPAGIGRTSAAVALLTAKCDPVTQDSLIEPARDQAAAACQGIARSEVAAFLDLDRTGGMTLEHRHGNDRNGRDHVRVALCTALQPGGLWPVRRGEHHTTHTDSRGASHITTAHDGMRGVTFPPDRGDRWQRIRWTAFRTPHRWPAGGAIRRPTPAPHRTDDQCNALGACPPKRPGLRLHEAAGAGNTSHPAERIHRERGHRTSSTADLPAGVHCVT